MKSVIALAVASMFCAGAAMAADAPKAAAPVVAKAAVAAFDKAKCIAEINREHYVYAALMSHGVKSGEIDPKEKASLEATHKKLVAEETKAASDHNLSEAECKKIHTMIAGEKAKLEAALKPAAAPAAPAAPAKPAAAPAAPAAPKKP